MQFGCCTAAGNYSALTRMGYDFIELSAWEVAHMEEDRYAALVEEITHGATPCLALNDYSHGELAMVGEGYDGDQARRYAKLVCRRGAALGVKTIGVGAPMSRRIPTGYPMEVAYRQCGDFLGILCEEAAVYGMLVLFEAVHRHMCDFVHTIPEALEVVTGLGLPNLFLVMDFYHMAVMGEDLEDIAYAAAYVRHCHVNHLGESLAREYPGPGDEALLRRILAALLRAGYNGGVSVEAVTEDFAVDAPRALAVLKRAHRAAAR